MKLAVIIPCYNEGKAISGVVEEYQQALPEADIYVFDNNSTDNTAQMAEKSGATVIHVARQGKGNVIRSAFLEIDADVYLMADGDGTYPADYAKTLIHQIVENHCDMVIGNRLDSYGTSKSRTGHQFANILLSKVVSHLFEAEVYDLLSGYRAFSRRFVKSLPLFSSGFEVETAISIHAIEVDAKTSSVDIQYRERVSGTESKLNSFKDGMKILLSILMLFGKYRPMLVYGGTSLILILLGLTTGFPVVLEFLETGLVPRFPTAILASALVILGVIFLATALILHAVYTSHRELKKLAFLSL